MRRFNLKEGKPVDRMEGETAIVTEDIAPGGVGKADLRGAAWNARSSAGAPLQKGQRCRVDRIEGLTLWLRPE